MALHQVALYKSDFGKVRRKSDKHWRCQMPTEILFSSPLVSLLFLFESFRPEKLNIRQYLVEI